MAAPVIRAVGTVAANAAAVSPGLPTGTVAGDLLLMFIESRGEQSAGASGWTQVLAPVSTGTTAAGSRITILYKVAAGGDATTTNDSGDHQIGRIIGIQAGTYNATNPFNATNTGTDDTSATAITIPSVTTTINDCLILGALTGNLPDATSTTQFDGWTNANLGSLTERIDNTSTAGDGGALGVVSGTFNSAGASGTISVNCVTWARRAKVTLAIAPAYYTYTSSLGVINAVGFEGTVQVLTPTHDASALLGSANAEGSVPSGVRFYDALGYIQSVGFAPTVDIVSRQANPDQGPVNFEGLVPSVEVISPSTGYDATGLLGEAQAVGFAPTIQIEYTALPQIGQVNAEGFAPAVTLEVPTTGEVHFTGSAATVTLEYEIVLSQDQGAGSGRFSPFERDEEDILEIVKLFLKKVA